MHSVFFRPSAATQVEHAHSWWREHRPAAPLAVGEELAHAVALIATQPAIGARATNARFPGVRRILLSRVGTGFTIAPFRPNRRPGLLAHAPWTRPVPEVIRDAGPLRGLATAGVRADDVAREWERVLGCGRA